IADDAARTFDKGEAGRLPVGEFAVLDEKIGGAAGIEETAAAIGRSGTARAFECEAAERDIGRIVEDEDGLLRSRYQCRPPRHAGDLDRLIDPEAGDDVSAGRND